MTRRVKGAAVYLSVFRRPCHRGELDGPKRIRAATLPLSRRLDVRCLRELLLNPDDALDLPLGRKTLVESLALERFHHVGPWRQPIRPAAHTTVRGLGILRSEIRRDAQHGLDRHRRRHEIIRIAPRIAPRVFGGLEEVAYDAVELVDLTLIGARLLEPPPDRRDPAMQLIEELRLENPLLLVAASAEAVDAVAERAVALA